MKPTDEEIKTLPRLQELARKRFANVKNAVSFLEIRNEEFASAFTQFEKLRSRLADRAMRLHRFSLRSAYVALFSMHDVPAQHAIPASLARAWEAELQDRLLVPWDPYKKRREKAERAGRRAAEISKRRVKDGRLRHLEK